MKSAITLLVLIFSLSAFADKHEHKDSEKHADHKHEKEHKDHKGHNHKKTSEKSTSHEGHNHAAEKKTEATAQ